MTTAALTVFGVGLGSAAVCDLWSRRIPNRLVLAFGMLGLATQALLAGPLGLATSVAGIAAGGGLLLLLFAMGWLGGGDVKLLAAAGAWLGPILALEAALLGLALGGLWAVALAVRNARLRRDVASYFLMAASGAAAKVERRAPALTVPLGATLAVGALTVALWQGGLFHA